MIRTFATCLALCAGQAWAGASSPSLGNVAAIREPLEAAALAFEIEQGCSDIERREVRVAIEGWKVAYRAQSMGYSRREIKSYVKNRDEISRLRDHARNVLTTSGVDLSDRGKVCAYGKKLIRANSLAGSLLREK
jgi:hypothetical protein